MRRRFLAIGAAGALGAAALGIAGWRHRGGAIDPVAAIAAAEASFAADNYSAARNHALEAIRADPTAPAPHVVLARAYLLLGEGLNAEAELDRAANGGAPATSLHHLRAHAALLQDDPDRALNEATQADANDTIYATRIAALAHEAKGDYRAAGTTMRALLTEHPKDAAAWADYGRMRQRGGDLAAAGRAADQALRLDHGLLDALTLKGELVRSAYGLNAALPWFEAALRHDAFYFPALIEYAGTLGDLGRYTDMLKAARDARLARPTDYRAFYLMAVLAARANDFDLARDLLQKTAGQINDLPGVQLLSGAIDYHDGAYQQALDSWRTLLYRQPMNLDARRLVGAALVQAGDPQGATETLRPLVARGDADPYALTVMARALEAVGRRGEAAAMLDRAALPGTGRVGDFTSDDSVPVLVGAMHDAPGDPTRRVAYLRGLLEDGNRATALAEAQAIARDYPGAAPAWVALGDVWAGFGRYDNAAAAYARAASIDFDEPTMLRLTDARDRANDREGSANALALYLDQNPDSISAQRLAAHWQVAAGDYAPAIETLEDLRGRIGNRDAALLAELSFAYTASDDPAAGAAYGRAAYALAPMSAPAADAWGWALYEQGRNEPGRQLLEKAAALAPDHSGIRWHLAQVYADLGRTADAIAAIDIALSRPDFADRAAAQALRRSLA